MKTPDSNQHFNTRPRVALSVAWTLAAATLCWGAAVQGGEESAKAASSVSPNTTAALPADGQTASQSSPDELSARVGEIVKMADARVSTEVIRAFVECSPTPYRLTGADIIALKQHKVADEVVTILLKQGAQTRALVAQTKNEALARALVNRNASSGGVDPEGYDYFQHYYLHPRTLASVYQRLAPYYVTSFYPYGAAPAFGFGPFGYGRSGYAGFRSGWAR